MIPSFLTTIYGDSISEKKDAIEQLNDLSFLLPAESIRASITQILVIAAITFSFYISVNFILLKSLPAAEREDKKKEEFILKQSYLYTHLLINAIIGTSGIYYFIYRIPGLRETYIEDSGFPHFEKINGYEDLTLFANLQLGYQIFSLYTGLFHVDEKKEMIIHHFAVVIVTSISMFCTIGYRYFTPFFYGVIEISSVPLSVMNIIQEMPTYKNNHPTTYVVVRLVFAFAFLTVRSYMWRPQIIDYCKHLLLVILIIDDWKAKVIHTCMLLSAILLTGLQMFWAYLIVKGIIKAFFKSKKVQKKEKN